MRNTNKPIIFGGESYPKYNNAIIMMGGAGTNKRRVVENLMQIEGEVFSYERGFEVALRTKKVKKKLLGWGFNLDTLDMTHSKNITDVYQKLESMGELKRGFPSDDFSITQLSNGDNLPNIIDIDEVEDGIDLYNLVFRLERSNYDKKNIHIVWVIEDYEDLKQRNLNSNDGRVISETDLMVTHEGTGRIMQKFLNKTLTLSEYMDGDIWLALGDHDIVQVKQTGSPIINDKFDDRILNIIYDRLPVIRW